MQRGSTSRGGCLHRGVGGGLHAGRGVRIQGAGDWADPPPIGYYGVRSTSGRYESYWNAFLLLPCFLSDNVSGKFIQFHLIL